MTSQVAPPLSTLHPPHAPSLNTLWAQWIIKELVHHGVRTFCISPGARCAPLVIAAADHPLTQTILHIDERGLAYHALGYAKGGQEVVALIVTSGTAVGNLLPAVMESYHDHLPLLLLTADRPPELRECGANQTTLQVGIFGHFVKWAVDLPCPSEPLSKAYIGTTIAQAVGYALSGPKGPVHINCMLREPLFEKESLSKESSLIPPSSSSHTACTTLSLGQTLVAQKTVELIAEDLSQYPRGVILVGGTAHLESIDPLISLARTLQWPIFPDIFSPLRRYGHRKGIIPYYDWILRGGAQQSKLVPQVILQFGERFVSSALNECLAKKERKLYYHISPHAHRRDPAHAVTHRIMSEVAPFIHTLLSFLSPAHHEEWLERWNRLNTLAGEEIESYFLKRQGLSEPLLFHRLSRSLPPQTSVFLSNSMSVRNGEALLVPEKSGGMIYGNRALSGIDGNIATSAGLARGSGRPLVALLGDLAFLHDLSSLSQLKEAPVHLVVINNHGGDIFHFLPITKHQELFIAPQEHKIKHAALLFDLPYGNPHTIEEFLSLLHAPTPSLIELHTSPGDNKSIHQELLQAITCRLAPILSALGSG